MVPYSTYRTVPSSIAGPVDEIARTTRHVQRPLSVLLSGHYSDDTGSSLIISSSLPGQVSYGFHGDSSSLINAERPAGAWIAQRPISQLSRRCSDGGSSNLVQVLSPVPGGTSYGLHSDSSILIGSERPVGRQ